jgi:hypothetical protein
MLPLVGKQGCPVWPCRLLTVQGYVLGDGVQLLACLPTEVPFHICKGPCGPAEEAYQQMPRVCGKNCGPVYTVLEEGWPLGPDQIESQLRKRQEPLLRGTSTVTQLLTRSLRKAEHLVGCW